jgi:hypothetical protein
MRPLAALERFLERLFERPAARLPGALLEPVTLVRRLERSIDQARRAGPDGMLAPSRFTIEVSEADATALGGMATLEDDLAEAALEHARKRGYRIPARPTVTLLGVAGLERGDVRVTADFADARWSIPGPDPLPEHTLVHPPAPAVRPGTCLRIHGPGVPSRDVPLDGLPLTIGRSADAGIVLADPLVSRRHARLAPRAGRLVLEDLGSTNGTHVNGRAVRETIVGPGDTIHLGGTRLEIVAPGGEGGA